VAIGWVVHHPWLTAGIVAGLVLGIGSFAPLPGYYNVQTTLTITVTSISIFGVQAAHYSISNVNPTTTGNSAVFDWAAACAICSSFITSNLKLEVCVGSHCNTIAETQLNSIANVEVGDSVTDQVTVGYVPAGTYSVTVTFTSGGSTAATGSGSVTVGGFLT
jgi:hypothetical protein